MDPTKLAQITYREGRVILADKHSMDELLRKGEEVLGFSPESHQYTFLFVSKQVQELTGINAVADVQNSRFLTSEQQHEATLFHEGVHYLMHRKGLIFGPDKNSATLYDRLVDETVAELATFEVYGHSELMSGKPTEKIYEDMRGRDVQQLICESMQSGAFQQIIEDAKKSGLPEELLDLLKSLPKEVDFTSMEIIKRHREIEKKYTNTKMKNFNAIDEDVAAYCEYLRSLDQEKAWRYLNEAVRGISFQNAQALNKSGVRAKDLVLWIDDAVKNEWNSYGIYFCDIVSQLNL